MTVDECPSIFSRQMATIVYLSPIEGFSFVLPTSQEILVQPYTSL